MNKKAFWPFSLSSSEHLLNIPEDEIVNLGDGNNILSLGGGHGLDLSDFYEYSDYCDKYPKAMETYHVKHKGPSLDYSEIVQRYGTKEEIRKLKSCAEKELNRRKNS